MLLKKLKNERIRARNRADFLHLADLRSRMFSSPLAGLSSSDKLRIEDDGVIRL